MYAGTVEDHVTGVTIGDTDHVFLTGYFGGTVDFGGGALTSAGPLDIYIVRFDTNGDHVWSERFGGTDSDYSFSIAADGSGGVIATGAFEGTIDLGGGPLVSSGGYDIFVSKFSPETPVPTLLAAFETNIRNGFVELSWRLSEAGGNTRFQVLRAEADRPFADLRGSHAEISGLDGAFTDSDVRPGQVYRYRVDVYDEDGCHTLFETDEISVPAATFTLGPVRPNPFNPQTSIHYTVPVISRVELSIYDTRGKLVRTLFNGVVSAGPGSALWNGRDNRGTVISSGVYFVRLTSGKQVRTARIVLLK